MAYMRGHYYLWSDSEDWIHIWNQDGYDAWNNTSWACDEDNVLREGMENASGVSLPEKVMDEYVLMRLAEMIHDGKIEETIDRFLGPDGQSGNVSGELLKQNAETLKQALSQIELQTPEPFWK